MHRNFPNIGVTFSEVPEALACGMAPDCFYIHKAGQKNGKDIGIIGVVGLAMGYWIGVPLNNGAPVIGENVTNIYED